MPRYLPGDDPTFTTWSSRFNGYVSNHFATIGLVQADVDALGDADTDWETKYTTHMNKHVEAKQARSNKAASRKAYEELIRPLVARIQACPTTTDADREGLGITVRGEGGGAGTPISELTEDKPLATIDISGRQQHVLRIENQNNVGTSKTRPPGVVACEVYVKVGAAPAGTGDMQLAGVAMKNSFVLDFADEDAGKQAHYALRWVTKTGERSRWSETESATIAA